jgi:hypothetical protein
MGSPRYLSDLAGTQQNQFRIRPSGSAGPPSSGYHRVGEEYVDVNGARWYCVASGTPGTWQGLGVGGTQALTLASTDYVLDTLDITKYRTTRWALEFKKNTNLLILEIVASHDGSAASEVRPTSMLIGSTADVAATVDINSGNLRLYVSADTTGWTATWQRLYTMGA